MSSHYASKLIGKKWENGARGPVTFDCWGLLVFVYANYYATAIEPYSGADAKDVSFTSEEASRVITRGDWIKIDEPVDGCAVAMSASQEISHVGIYLVQGNEGLLLHCTERGGVVCQRISTLRNYKINILGYYLPKNWPATPNL